MTVDWVWQQMKLKAAEYAREGRTPTAAEAQRIVALLMHEAHVDVTPGPEVIDFYAREMRAAAAALAAKCD
jgi:hypothetical protein